MAIFSSATQGTVVTSSATQIFSLTPSIGGSAVALVNPRDVTIVNQGTATIYIGGSTVTAAASGGPTLSPGGQMTLGGQAAQNLWAITAAGSATVTAALATVDAVV